MATALSTKPVARCSVRSRSASLRVSSWRAQAKPLADASVSATRTPMSRCRRRAWRRRACSARRTISSSPRPRRPATSFCLAISLPSPCGRASAAIGSSRSLGQRTVRAELEAQRGRETFALRIARLAVDDQRDHAIGAAESLEAADFLVDIFALRGVRRTQHDEELRGFERGERLLGQRMSGGKILAVAEDRPQASSAPGPRSVCDRPDPCRCDSFRAPNAATCPTRCRGGYSLGTRGT